MGSSLKQYVKCSVVAGEQPGYPDKFLVIDLVVEIGNLVINQHVDLNLGKIEINMAEIVYQPG